MIDICYGSNKSKDMVWSVGGEQIIKNLLNKNEGVISYPIQSDDYDFEFKGINFKMVSKQSRLYKGE